MGDLGPYQEKPYISQKKLKSSDLASLGYMEVAHRSPGECLLIIPKGDAHKMAHCAMTLFQAREDVQPSPLMTFA